MHQEFLWSTAPMRQRTEGIKYAGSKLKLLPDILSLVGELPGRTVWDAFAGTTRVSQALAQKGYNVVSSDISVWSECFATCYLVNTQPREYYAPIIEYLNHLSPVDGWFSEHYGSLLSAKEGGAKRPWQLKNTRKLDAIREEIDKLDLPRVEKCVLLTALILALDKVDNTLGHYVSYLREWSPRSYNDLHLVVPHLIYSGGEHSVWRGDIFNLMPKVSADIAYLDPPYGSHNEKMPPSRVRYRSYYHIWTTIVLNDRPSLFGRANRRCDTSDAVAASVFEEYKRNPSTLRFMAVEAIDKMLHELQSEYIILSYSSTGRATGEELMDVLANNGKLLKIRSVDYKKNIMSEMKWTNEWIKEVPEQNREFLFVLKKG